MLGVPSFKNQEEMPRSGAKDGIYAKPTNFGGKESTGISVDELCVCQKKAKCYL